MSRVAVIGLDCLPPELVFDRWAGDLPALNALMRGGAFAPLRTCVPPITVPAWSCMLSSKDPGQLGVYGFRNRLSYNYDDLGVATSKSIKHDRVWDILGREGQSSLLIGIPGTFPPPKIRGNVVADFLTPAKSSAYTHPPELKQEVERLAPDYQFDVNDFRNADRQGLLDQLFRMTTARFELSRQLIQRVPWNFFMVHEIGPDRVHHAFWGSMDPEHRKYVAGNQFESAIYDYYRHMDAEVGRLVDALPADTHVIVASDHGSQTMRGGICVNEWLIRRGWLTLKSTPATPTSLAKAEVDWSKTMAWGEGGYYARVFFNVKGREPEGRLDPAEYETFAEELRRELQALPDDQGRPMRTKVYRSQEIYREVNAIAPDLTVLFDDLAWRSVGSVGLNSVYTFENDTGPDDANHSMSGILIMKPSGRHADPERLREPVIYDVAPTVLDLMGVEAPEDMIGHTLLAA